MLYSTPIPLLGINQLRLSRLIWKYLDTSLINGTSHDILENLTVSPDHPGKIVKRTHIYFLGQPLEEVQSF